MELRHLRCFLAVAEEVHFARAAEKLHIEQSPLSRAIKELEEELGVVLSARTTRSTRLTRDGKLFLDHVPRVFAALQQARDSVKAAANGFHGQLRIALSAGITPSRLPALLALCRQEEPEVDIRLTEVPLAQRIKGLHDDLFDVDFARAQSLAGPRTHPSGRTSALAGHGYSTGRLSAADGVLIELAHHAYTSAFHSIFGVLAALSILTAVVCIVTLRQPADPHSTA
nr:LysR family transcriptional regulator [Burkholderia gladioli]